MSARVYRYEDRYVGQALTLRHRFAYADGEPVPLSSASIRIVNSDGARVVDDVAIPEGDFLGNGRIKHVWTPDTAGHYRVQYFGMAGAEPHISDPIEIRIRERI